jgi:pyruvate/2-oxoglutarate dehydrogenase complex dihydrolipoamide acyltransferase (E2) component
MMMSCTLSADHRVLDGATGARFLSTFKGLIEHPATMIGLPVPASGTDRERPS